MISFLENEQDIVTVATVLAHGVTHGLHYEGSAVAPLIADHMRSEMSRKNLQFPVNQLDILPDVATVWKMIIARSEQEARENDMASRN